MPFTHGHALLIGVGAYQHAPHMNVPITVADARALAQVLRDPRFCGYPESQVMLLHDDMATGAGILAALDQLAERADPDDTVVLFYCGHGDFGDDGDYYLTSHETRVANRKVVAGTGVSQRALLEKLKVLRAQRVLVIFNACHSGAVAPTLGAADVETGPTGQNPPDETTAALLATGAGRIIITACRAEQLSYIGTDKLTLFTQALVSGLLGQGVAGRNGYISAFDLYTHVYSTVSEKVKNDYAAVQEPELTILKGVGPFAVALYRGATALGAFEEQAPPAPNAAVRAVSQEESRRALERIVSVGQGVAIGGDMTGGTVVGRDQTNVNTGGGDYVNTGGGDYAGGNIDKRQGAFVSGGTIYGTVVGSNQGTITTNYGSQSRAGGDAAHPSVEQALTQARQATEQARRHGDDDLADDLQSVIAPLEAALRAEQTGRAERRDAKIAEAREALGRLAGGHPELRGLADALGRVA